jgi:hypothetical protein
MRFRRVKRLRSRSPLETFRRSGDGESLQTSRHQSCPTRMHSRMPCIRQMAYPPLLPSAERKHDAHHARESDDHRRRNVHGFVEGNMLSRFDLTSCSVIVQDVLHSFGMAKEDTDTRVGYNAFRTLRQVRHNTRHTTTKDPKQAKVWFAIGADREGRNKAITMHSHIVQSEKVLKSIGPKWDARQAPRSIARIASVMVG